MPDTSVSGDVSTPVAVVIDTNVWIQENGLRTAVGAALIAHLRLIGGRIVLPQVVEMELIQKLADVARDKRDQVANGLRLLREITGRAPHVDLPTDDAIGESISAWLDRLNPLLVRVAITAEGAVSAVQNAVQKRAPSHRREQVRDDLIWQAAAESALTTRTFLVTQDGDFWNEGGLHEHLQSEVEGRGLNLSVVRQIAQVLQEIAPELERAYDSEELGRSIWSVVEPDVENQAAEAGFVVLRLAAPHTTLYATESPDLISVEFELVLDLEDVPSENQLRMIGAEEWIPYVREEAFAEVVGSAFVDQDLAIQSATIGSVSFNWIELGSLRRTRNVRVAATLGLRSRTDRLQHRYRLN